MFSILLTTLDFIRRTDFNGGRGFNVTMRQDTDFRPGASASTQPHVSSARRLRIRHLGRFSTRVIRVHTFKPCVSMYNGILILIFLLSELPTIYPSMAFTQ